ncbi:unnamed protein product [Phytophthora lilii]|uniref:Unnamed protein product n=1 Tax=Phytophthora lilii TaxID=2077276 RepID=A0A9W6UAK0_9STRA|nr:unnamed protein product [Phytophthora lilii]
MLQLRNGGPRYWDLASGDDEGIFADLLTLVVKTRLEMQRRRVENPRSLLSFATWGISIGEPHVRPDSEAGVVMETHACSLVPFNVRTTAAAYWRMFSLSFTKDRLNVNDVSYLSRLPIMKILGKGDPLHNLYGQTERSDVFARSFTCSSTHFGRQIDMRGKHTCRKFVDEDGSITMVFAGRTGPADTNAPCHEVQIQKSGWVKVRQLEGQDSDNQSSAMVEIHSEMLPRFRNGIVGQEHRAREVINYVVKSHHVMNDLCRQMLSELLVEEDWKAFRGDGTEVAA